MPAHIFTALGLGAYLLICSSGSAKAHGGERLFRPFSGQMPWAHGIQTLPPPLTPSLFRTFQFLLAGYEVGYAALGPDAAITFGQWLVLNGITDPREFSCLMWLWSSHCASRHAA